MNALYAELSYLLPLLGPPPANPLNTFVVRITSRIFSLVRVAYDRRVTCLAPNDSDYEDIF